jgi:hypothetical protein
MLCENHYPSEGPQGAVRLGYAPSFAVLLLLGPRACALQSKPSQNAVTLNEGLSRRGNVILVKADCVAAIAAFVDAKFLHAIITRGLRQNHLLRST